MLKTSVDSRFRGRRVVVVAAQSKHPQKRARCSFSREEGGGDGGTLENKGVCSFSRLVAPWQIATALKKQPCCSFSREAGGPIRVALIVGFVSLLLQVPVVI